MRILSDKYALLLGGLLNEFSELKQGFEHSAQILERRKRESPFTVAAGESECCILSLLLFLGSQQVLVYRGDNLNNMQLWLQSLELG